MGAGKKDAGVRRSVQINNNVGTKMGSKDLLAGLIRNNSLDKKRPIAHTKCYSSITPPPTNNSEHGHLNNGPPREAKHSPPPHGPKAKADHDDLANYLNTSENPHVKKNLQSNNNLLRKALAPIRSSGINRAITPVLGRDRPTEVKYLRLFVY